MLLNKNIKYKKIYKTLVTKIKLLRQNRGNIKKERMKYFVYKDKRITRNRKTI